MKLRGIGSIAGFALAASGCTGGASGENVPGQGAFMAQDDFQEASMALPENLYPVRISRDLFEQQVAGKVVIQGLPNQSPAEFQSGIDWQEYPTTLPAPEGEYLADFRDFEACAIFGGLGDVRLCFDVAPDVSTLDLGTERMRVRGLEQWIAQVTGCGMPALRFIEAKRVGEGFQVYFAGQCQGGEIPVLVELSIRQL